MKKVRLKDSDELWLAGDLINRGPDSLKVLRKLRQLGEQTRIVLGATMICTSWLLYLAAIRLVRRIPWVICWRLMMLKSLAHWLRRQKLLHSDYGHTMVHAGLPPQWDLDHAQTYAQEVEAVIGQSDKDAAAAAISYRDFFASMYGNKPSRWDPALTGMDRDCVVSSII